MIRRLAAFRGQRGRRLDDLITALLKRDGTNWNVQFVSDGRVPENFGSPSLSEAIKRADHDVAHLYPADTPARATAELTYAIYPWKSAGRIFQVTIRPEGPIARSIENPAESLAGATWEELVSATESSLADPSEVVFEWDRRVRELG